MISPWNLIRRAAVTRYVRLSIRRRIRSSVRLSAYPSVVLLSPVSHSTNLSGFIICPLAIRICSNIRSPIYGSTRLSARRLSACRLSARRLSAPPTIRRRLPVGLPQSTRVFNPDQCLPRGLNGDKKDEPSRISWWGCPGW